MGHERDTRLSVGKLKWSCWAAEKRKNFRREMKEGKSPGKETIGEGSRLARYKDIIKRGNRRTSVWSKGNIVPLTQMAAQGRYDGEKSR